MLEVKEKTIDIKSVILDHFNMSDYFKGVSYLSTYVDYVGDVREGKSIYHYFLVESERTMKRYRCNFLINQEGNIERYSCSCPQFNSTHSCKHLAACLVNYGEKILQRSIPIDYKSITNQLFDYLKSDREKIKRKEELKVKFILENNEYRISEYTISLQIGTNKLYKCNYNKLKKLLDAIEHEEEMYFGKDFTYKPSEQYFNDKDKNIIDFLFSIKTEGYYYGGFELSFNQYNIKKLLVLLDKDYILNDYNIKSINNEFPLETKLNLKDKNYILDIFPYEEFMPLTDDFEYVQHKDILYHLDSKKSKLLGIIMVNSIEKLEFTDEKLDLFKGTVLPTIKENIDISKNIDNIVIPTEPDVKLYFDLYKDKIECKIKFSYDDNVIDYFDKPNKILRDTDYEEGVYLDILNYGFDVSKNRFLLSDIDSIVKFIEEDITELSKKYEVFTSEKLKDTEVIKKAKVSSSFSIGKDNIMSYSFDLGDINSDEIVNIFKSLDEKKKYYRLKNGNILDLEENSELKQLQELSNELDLSNKDIESGEGVIPKYKAIYLDSLKDSKYHVIKTDNLFRDLINKFNAYKDSNINLSKSKLEILRNYQLDGVKWLYNIHKTGFGGILADEMGLGKSIQTIYFFMQLLKENKNSKFMIVVPTSLVYNWEAEFRKFAPKLNYVVSAGLRKKREELLNILSSYNIVITSYGLLREDFEYYKDINFDVLIIDEAQNIKNPNTAITKCVKEINSNTKIALTGTPIENSVGELWSIFDYIMPGFLGNLKKFEQRYKVNEFDDDTNKKLDTLNNLIKPFILRRKKVDVIDNLPEKIENNIYVELTKEQKKIYLAELEKVNKQMDEALQNGGISQARFLILRLLTKLRQICIDPKIIFENYTGGSGKMDTFVDVVSQYVGQGHKILVFTSFKTALDLAKSNLLKKGISSYVISGSVSSKKRMELAIKFNEDDTNVFFIMLKAGGTGLNLTGADTVIHLDLWWNPQAENQATDRAHRIGQKNVVEVIKFVTKGTIEEKILDLQNKKKILSDKLIDKNSGENSFSKLTEKDIKKLLSFENEE